MSEPYKSPEQPSKPVAGATPTFRRPGWAAWGFWAFFATAFVVVQFFHSSVQGLVFDQALVNAISFFACFLSLVVLWVWFVFQSGVALPTRRIVFWSAVAAMVAFFSVVRLEGMTGHMIPTRVRLVWQPKPDVAASRELGDKYAQASPGKSDATSASDPLAGDWTGFLGADRRNHVAGLTLAEWDKSPPRVLWRKKVGAGWSSFAVQGRYALTMEQLDGAEWATCRDVTTGELIWGKPAEGRHEETLGGVGPRSTPTIDGERVYFVGATGLVRCLELATGEEQWRDDLLARYFPGESPAARQAASEALVKWGRAGSPLIVGDLVVVPAGGPVKERMFAGKSLIAYDKRTGEVKWEGGATQIAYASPTLMTFAGHEQIVIVNESNVAGHDPGDGRVLWTYPWGGHSESDASNSQPYALGDAKVLITKGYFLGSSVFEVVQDGDDFMTKEVWMNKRALKTKFTNAVVIGAHAYGLNDGIMECVSLADGKSVWKSRKGNFGHGQVLGVGDKIIVLGENGKMALVAADPVGYRETGRFQALQGVTWNCLSLAGRRLLVRNGEEAACFELK